MYRNVDWRNPKMKSLSKFNACYYTNFQGGCLTRTLEQSDALTNPPYCQCSTTGVRFTTCCRALTEGLSLTLNLTTNSTIPISQPLSCVSLACANLSLSLTSQFSQWSSSIETTSSDQSVNRSCRCLMFPVSLNSKVNTRSFLQADTI